MKNIICNYLKDYKNKIKIQFHNKKVFKKIILDKKKKSVILLELTPNQLTNIANSYFSYYFSSKYKSKVVAYDLNYSTKIHSNIFFYFKKIFNINEFGIYKSFGTNEFFKININKSHVQKSAKFLKTKLSSINTKNQFLNLKVNDVLIGDLIYDTYLKNYNQFTINLNDIQFKIFVKKMLEIFFFWEDYFKNNEVICINVSHTVYQNAIPLRIAIKYKIPAYQFGFANAFYLTKENIYASKDFLYYKNLFSALPKNLQKKGKEIAMKKLTRRLNGEVGVDMVYSTKSAFHDKKIKSKISKSSNYKILIVPHCFYDNPHPYGNNIFPDIYEWLEFLGKFSEKTDYEWYIKSHADFIPQTREKLIELTKRFKKFVLLPSNISHHQIIDEGIKVALTCWGTIGSEYPLLGIPVINASQNNPHINYDFNVHVKSRKEYEKILSNLSNINLNFDKGQLYEYYYMRHLYFSLNLFDKNYYGLIEQMGGYSKLFNSSIYDFWTETFSKEKHKSIMTITRDFINSKRYRLKI